MCVSKPSQIKPGYLDLITTHRLHHQSNLKDATAPYVYRSVVFKKTKWETNITTCLTVIHHNKHSHKHCLLIKAVCCAVAALRVKSLLISQFKHCVDATIMFARPHNILKMISWWKTPLVMSGDWQQGKRNLMHVLIRKTLGNLCVYYDGLLKLRNWILILNSSRWLLLKGRESLVFFDLTHYAERVQTLTAKKTRTRREEKL